jgi:hypothetical protein
MNFRNILIIVFICVILYYTFKWMSSNSITLTGMLAGNVQTMIDYTKLAKTSDGSVPINFTYSIWFYVNDWNYGYGKKKVIFGRMTAPSTGVLPNDISGSGPCPLVVLGEIQNTLRIFLTVYPNTNLTPNASTGQINSMIHECSLMNIPIQKWVNLLISVYGRTLDVYLDGKLIKTCAMPGIAMVSTNSNVYVTPYNGFSGWTSRFQFYPNPTDPQTAWNIYQGGPVSSNPITGIFDSIRTYGLKMALMNNGQEQSSLTI